MAKDPIKKAENGTYYFRANLGYHPVTGKQIQKYRSGFSTKKEARAEYSKLILASTEELADKKEDITFKKFIEEIYLPWYKTQVKESTYKNRYSIGRAFPIWIRLYTVGPQTYIRTFPSSRGTNSSFLRVSVLKSFMFYSSSFLYH